MVFRVAKGNIYTIIEDREPSVDAEEEIIDPKNVCFYHLHVNLKHFLCLAQSCQKTSFYPAVSTR